MTEVFDPDAFKRRLRSQLKASREAFDGLYKNELEQLAGLSRLEIDAIVPGTVDIQKYDELMTVVKEASRINLGQAELRSNIIKLGEIAVAIAKKVPAIAAII